MNQDQRKSIQCTSCGTYNWATLSACKCCHAPLIQNREPDYVQPHWIEETYAPGPVSHNPSQAQMMPGFDAPTRAAEAWLPTPPPEPTLIAAPPLPPAAHFSPTTPYHQPQYEPYRIEEEDPNWLEIDFQVAPFVDAETTVKDTYALWRSCFGLVSRIVLVVIAPLALLMFISGAYNFMNFAGTPSAASVASSSEGSRVLFMIVVLLGFYYVRYAVLPSAIIYGIVTSLSTGEAPSLAKCYGWGVRRSVSTGLSLFLSIALILLGLLFLIVPGVILGMAFSLVVPVAVIEGRGAFDIMGRSYNLTKGRRGTIFLATLAWMVIMFVIALFSGLAIGVIGQILGSEAFTSIGGIIMTEFISASSTVLSLVMYLGIAHHRGDPHLNMPLLPPLPPTPAEWAQLAQQQQPPPRF